MKKIILASSSPRRKEILEKYNVNFQIIKSHIDEKISIKDDPFQVVMSLAFQKAEDISKGIDYDAIVLAADTVVYMDRVIGKPKDEGDAYRILESLSGKEHLVITGIAIIDTSSKKKIVDYEITKVKFRELQPEKINSYISTGEFKDKAGAYGIQGYGEILVDWIEGPYSNVVGFPIVKIDKLLEKHFSTKIL
ncbi:Maf-like protein Clos_1767 [Proteiniborus sp. DW1]|uniref:nucleoside triphosphate pyrophosphatase n=1 Tax=Proteiniborus sp. DW1 TaxID=1889883 RepID=UPI00092DF273|nr:nucleoside triphosphate pyrophosphatase [Proteiniborus sp. DW1]SCG83739.1 Maf-like protein Clos_1767 [Proteiniborus sp. DW1]